VKFKKQTILLILVIAVTFLFIFFVALQGGKKFTLDEMDFPTVAKATSHTLRPVWYKGEVTNHQSGLFHPPLYIYSLALFIRTFGFSEMTVRFFGLVCALISAYLLVRILRLFKFKNRWGEALLLGLFLLNPYTVACVTVPDIDTTVLPITLLLFLYLTLRTYWKRDLSKKYEIILLGAVFSLNLWAKLTTPLMLPFFLFVLLLVCGFKFRDSLLKTIKVTFLGAVLFIVTYFIYTKAVSLPMSYTFKFLIQSFTKGTNGDQTLVTKILSNVSSAKTQIYWYTIPLTFAYLISLLGISFDKRKDMETNIIRLLSYFGLAVLIFYLCLIAPFGGFFKYPFPIFGLMILTIVFYYQRFLSAIKINYYLAGFILTLSFLIETRYFKDNVFLNHSVFKGLIYFGLAVLIGYGLLSARKTSAYAKLIFIYFLFVVIGYQLGVTRVQAISTYPTKYLYGQQGMNETINYLKLNTKSSEVIWSMKDVGFYVNDRYYENYPFFFDDKLQPTLINMLKEGKIRYYVVTTGIGEDRVDYYKGIANILDQYATKKATFGNFIIYYSNDAPSNQSETVINRG
jgi:4-amino-4-deoxy-L-arabinose transferase-like glycosyltransferase